MYVHVWLDCISLQDTANQDFHAKPWWLL